MTKEELLKIYDEYKDVENLLIALHIHMPDDSIETIVNRKAHEKIKYIDKTYNDNLVHCNSEDIYIVDVEFADDENPNRHLDFGTAINLMKRNKRVSREGWNGKGMFIYYVPPGCYEPKTKVAANHCTNDKGKVPYRDYIAMKTVDGMIVPWLASQTDMLARDWFVVENN